MSDAPIDIRPVKSSRDLMRFLKVPYAIYRNDPNWVAPLLVERKEFFDRQKNPFFKYADVELFVAYRDNRPVGRISAHIGHTHNSFHKEKTGCFGFFESVDDYAVAEKLLQTAVDWVRKQGMDRVRGPLNFTTNHDVGLLVVGYDRPPVFMMTYNPRYYADFLEKFGFAKAMDLYAYYGTAAQGIPPRLMRVIERVKKRSGCTVRSINFANFESEVAAIKEVYNGAWAANWGFVPLTDDEFDFTAKDMSKIADPELILIAEDHGRPVGFSMALPDLNQALIKLNGRLLPFGLLKLLWLTKVRKITDGIRVITMGFLAEYQKRGLDNVLYLETFKRGVDLGYHWAETSWILENNEMMNRVAENLGYDRYKTYRIYDYDLS